MRDTVSVNVMGGVGTTTSATTGRWSEAAAQSVAERFALVDADVVMSYRIAPGGLLAWLDFASEARFRRAGADVILTYYARQAARWLRQG